MTKHFLWILRVFLLVVGLVLGSFPAEGWADEQGTIQTYNFVFVNYIGQELTLDLDDVTYTVPGTNTLPDGGRLSLHLTPGSHKFAANGAGIDTGYAGEFTIPPDGYVAKAAHLQESAPAVSHDGILLAKPYKYVAVFDFDPLRQPVETGMAVDTWQPAPAQPGQASLVWINDGGVDELTIDLAGQSYKVPPKAGDIPGRLPIDLAPGLYRYTASVPNGGLSGEIDLAVGQVIGLSVTSYRPKPEYDVNDEFDALPQATLTLAELDWTATATMNQAGQIELVPPELPLTGAEIVSPTLEAVLAPGLVLKNYAGETLLLTISGQVYPVEHNSEQIITLSPGHYTYTASLPFIATTGEVDLAAGQRLELSVVKDFGSNFLTIYQN